MPSTAARPRPATCSSPSQARRTTACRHVGEALAKGAAAVVAECWTEIPDAAFVKVADARAALAHAAARFYPRQPETIVAVTGTSGKTSVVAFVRQIWQALAHESASIGTLGVVSRPLTVYGSLTTPDPIALHELLDRLAASGVTHLAMEASSHGLDQKRLDGVRLAAGAFTNLTRDHMDYHATVEDYLAAKLRLFQRPAARRGAGRDRRRQRHRPAGDCGGAGARARGGDGRKERRDDPARLGRARSLLVDSRPGVRRSPPAPDVSAAGRLPDLERAGRRGLSIASGSEADAVFHALQRLHGAPGRLERVGEVRGAAVFVDYAHKPDALEKALAALRPFVRRRLVLVFGCGGDRDPGKRPIMGAIAARLADVAIVTDDNPRSEDPAAIRAEILAAAPSAIEIGDRGAAIRAGVAMLADGDALMIAGKGHETGQIVGANTLPFSDADEARAALKEAA